jgi:hypothetical protein
MNPSANRRQPQELRHSARVAGSPRHTLDEDLDALFEELGQELCANSANSGGCTEARRLSSKTAYHGSLHLGQGLYAVEGRLGRALREIGAVKPVNHLAVSSFLERELFGREAPFSTALAMGAMRAIPSATPRAALREIVLDPPLGIAELARLALRVLTHVATADDLEFLVGMLHAADDDLHSKSMVALLGFAEGREALAEYLRTYSSRIDPHARLDLARALRKSRLTSDPVVVTALITSGQPHVVEAVTRALADDHGWGTPAQGENVERLAGLLRSELPHESRERIVSALGSAGAAGHTALAGLVREQKLQTGELVSALSVLRRDSDYRDEATTTLIGSLQRARHPDDVLAILHALDGDVSRDVVGSELASWARAHQEVLPGVLAALSGPGVSQRVVAMARRAGLENNSNVGGEE